MKVRVFFNFWSFGLILYVLYKFFHVGSPSPTHAVPEVAPPPVGPPPPPTVVCGSSKGEFRIVVDRSASPNASRLFLSMVQHDYFGGEGVAFFRVNEFITQFGVRERVHKFEEPGTTRETRLPDRDLNVDKAQRVPFKRGDMAHLGGRQFIVVIHPNRHMGMNNHDTVLGRVPEEDMQRVFDRLYKYNDIIDYPKRGPGPDQTKIYRNGWAYLNEEFPLVDRITGCSLANE